MKIFQKYNNKYTVGVTMLLFAFTFSCADLDENPGKVQLSPESLSSTETLEGVITSLYRTALNANRWSDYHLAGYGGDDITTESSLNSGNKDGFRDSDWRRQTSLSQRTEMAYREPYKIIASANVVINGQDKIVNGKTEDKNRFVGEAYFLRAYAYMHLTRTYGKIPIIISNDIGDLPSRAEFLEIYQLIEADLKKAEELLPKVYPNIPAIGARPSQGAAKGFLARLYMHWAGFPIKDNSKYALAAQKAGEVINGGYGYSLSDNLRKMWTVADRFNHNESVFNIVFCQAPCGGPYGNRTTGRLGLVKEAGGWQETFGEIAFYEDMEANATAEGTLARFNDTYIHEQIPRGSKPLGADWRNWSDPHPILRKVVGGDMNEKKEVVNTTNNNVNRYIMRYADVLLMYAEASGRSGNVTAAAWEALNKVRRRAAGNNPNTADPAIDKTSGDIAEIAYMERKWELAGEYERWHDLVRMERFTDPNHVRRSPIEPVDVFNNQTPAQSGEALYFTPIPNYALNLNPNLKN